MTMRVAAVCGSLMIAFSLPLAIDAADAAGFIEGAQTDATLGGDGTALCDVNGDGYDDVVVASSNYNAGETQEGAVFIFHGGTSGIGLQNPSTADTTLRGGIGYQHFAESVACAGDVDNDGYDDIIVGNWHFYSNASPPFHGYIGAAYIYRGSSSGIPDGDRSTATGVLLSDHESSKFGASVAGAGDVNDDGYDDVIVGAHEYPCAGDGAAFVFHGSNDGIGDGNTLSLYDGRLCSDDVDSDLGISVASAGDVDGDDFDDVIVGARYYDAGGVGLQSGAALLMLGSSAGVGDHTPATVDVLITTPDDYANLGASVAGAGDVNGDGFDDVIIGAPQYDSGAAALIFLGDGATGLVGTTAEQAATTLSGHWLEKFGETVSTAGDVNHDGYADVVVAASSAEHGATEGKAFFYLGSAQGIDSVYSSLSGDVFPADGTNFWYWGLSAGGDIDNDGMDDVVIGVPSYSGTYTNEGIAYCVHGSGLIFQDGFESGWTFAWGS